MNLTEEEAQSLAEKIQYEGFDYYFTGYGPDPKLEEIAGKEITDYINAKKALLDALAGNGIDLEQ